MLHLGLPVRVGGLMVNQADLLHGDANGVTNIPLDIVTEVADISSEFVASEDIMLDYVKAPGEKTVAEFDACRNEFMEVVSKLKARVSRG
jgi:regulator of RNase E activity RraA